MVQNNTVVIQSSVVRFQLSRTRSVQVKCPASLDDPAEPDPVVVVEMCPDLEHANLGVFFSLLAEPAMSAPL